MVVAMVGLTKLIMFTLQQEAIVLVRLLIIDANYASDNHIGVLIMSGLTVIRPEVVFTERSEEIISTYFALNSQMMHER